MSDERIGFIAFHKGKSFTLAAKNKKEAWDQAADHFGVSKRNAHRHIHLEEAPIGPGSNT